MHRGGQDRRLRQSRRGGGGPRLGAGRLSPVRQFTGSLAPGSGAGFAAAGGAAAAGRAAIPPGLSPSSSSVSWVATARPPIPGVASAITTCRPAGAAYVMIIALAGSCWSSCCSTRNSRERCRARASDSLSPVAIVVVRPHAVLQDRPVLNESLSPTLRESLSWVLRE